MELADREAEVRLPRVPLTHAALRIAGGTNGILIGLYLNLDAEEAK